MEEIPDLVTKLAVLRLLAGCENCSTLHHSRRTSLLQPTGVKRSNHYPKKEKKRDHIRACDLLHKVVIRVAVRQKRIRSDVLDGISEKNFHGQQVSCVHADLRARGRSPSLSRGTSWYVCRHLTEVIVV